MKMLLERRVDAALAGVLSTRDFSAPPHGRPPPAGLAAATALLRYLAGQLPAFELSADDVPLPAAFVERSTDPAGRHSQSVTMPTAPPVDHQEYHLHQAADIAAS